MKSPPPLVLALGWLGASERHLSKYTSWHNSQGRDTLSTISPTTSILLPQLGRTQAAQMLEHAMELSEQQEHGGRRPLLFHVFSNNGLYFYANMLHQVAQNKRYEQVLHSTLGCIFDSTPSHLSVDIFAKGFGGALLGALGITHNGRPAYDHWLVYPLIRAFFYAPSFCRKNLVTLLDAYTYFQPKCPHLFLYSKADELIPHTDVEQAIQLTTNMDIPTKERCWEDSPHVAHFRLHPDEYSGLVRDFLHDCADRWRDSDQKTPIMQYQPGPLSHQDLANAAAAWKRFIIRF